MYIAMDICVYYRTQAIYLQLIVKTWAKKKTTEEKNQILDCNTNILTNDNVALLTCPCSQLPNVPMCPYFTSETSWEVCAYTYSYVVSPKVFSRRNKY